MIVCALYTGSVVLLHVLSCRALSSLCWYLGVALPHPSVCPWCQLSTSPIPHSLARSLASCTAGNNSLHRTCILPYMVI